MSDELNLADLDEGGKDEAQGGGKKIGFLSELTIQILKWAAIIIGAIIFIVVVVVITVNTITDARGASQSRLPVSEAYTDTPPVYEWFRVTEENEQLRGTTADTPRQTFLVSLHLGYDRNNRAVTTELIDRRIQIRGRVLQYFSNRRASELLGAENQERVKRDLLNIINTLLGGSARIRDIEFDEYQIIEF